MKFDKLVLLGLVFGIGGILFGNMIEGGHIASLIQGPAAIIVFGGTLGAVLLSSRGEDFATAIQQGKAVFFHQSAASFRAAYSDILDCNKIARKENLLAVQARIPKLSDPFLKDVMQAVVDGVDPQSIQDIFETVIITEEDKLIGGAKVWMDAGGYSPTVGIIGAVLGLIHVMQNLTDTSKLGGGIAVAFVATIYGVGAANLIFLPLGNKIKKRAQEASRLRTMMLEGALCIQKGLNPTLTEQKLKSYLPTV